MRLGRIKHPTLGECVKVALSHWEGPESPGDEGQRVMTEHLFPKNQSARAVYPRHPSGFDQSGARSLCVSPSASYYSQLCKYGEFRWSEKDPSGDSR